MSRFNLPVLKSTTVLTPEQLLRQSLHAEEMYVSTLGDGASFEYGLAVLGTEFPSLPEANQVRDIAPPDNLTPDQVIAQVNELFAARQLTCQRWYFAGGENPPAYTAPLAAHGFRPVPCDLWSMRHPQNLASRPGITVIPSRASFTKLAELAESAERAWGTTTDLEFYGPAAIRHLDDPRVDGLLALQDQTPVGAVSLMILGELGLIINLYTHPDHLRQGVATALLDHLVELAARSRLRYLTLFCDAANATAQALYEKIGFVKTATATYFELIATEQS